MRWLSPSSGKGKGSPLAPLDNAILLALKMEAGCSSEILVIIYHCTRCHDLDDHN
jgi:hypothetical protein